jgi:hypothetical protein
MRLLLDNSGVSLPVVLGTFYVFNPASITELPGKCRGVCWHALISAFPSISSIKNMGRRKQ